LPMLGYWVKVKQPGKLILNNFIGRAIEVGIVRQKQREVIR